MRLLFAEQACEDYRYWQTQDRQMVVRTNRLIAETVRDLFSGPGKPEPLKHALAGIWSRRITEEHRMLNRIVDGDLLLAQLRCHYSQVSKMPTLNAQVTAEI